MYTNCIPPFVYTVCYRDKILKIEARRKNIFCTFHILNSLRDWYGVGPETLWLSQGGERSISLAEKNL